MRAIVSMHSKRVWPIVSVHKKCDKNFSEKLDKNLRFSYSSLKIIYSTHTHAAAARVGKVKPHTLPMVNVGLTKTRSKIRILVAVIRILVTKSNTLGT